MSETSYRFARVSFRVFRNVKILFVRRNKRRLYRVMKLQRLKADLDLIRTRLCDTLKHPVMDLLSTNWKHATTPQYNPVNTIVLYFDSLSPGNNLYLDHDYASTYKGVESCVHSTEIEASLPIYRPIKRVQLSRVLELVA